MYRLITISVLIGLLLLPVSGQTVPEDLVKAIREGNAAEMSEFFHQSLELTILEEDYVASKNQATRIMENFFKKHPPDEFTISFEGTKERSRYAIGSLRCRDAAFRVNLFFLNRQDESLIYYLSIEKESSYEFYP
ncbi:MAG: DUF4783 domain-containing protein [Bacteroidales bacterium]